MGPTIHLDESAVESVTGRVHGDVLRPSDDGYEEARTVWNGMIDKEPAVIARCTGAADVMAAVDFARDQDLPVAVKSGGHHIAGHAVCDDGLVVDLTPMDGVRVDPAAKTVRVQGGATWGDLNHETRALGLEIVGNPYDEVGVGGYTLGGGIGLLSRTYGLAIDNLRAVDVVTAAGELVHASSVDHPDLFWALRGGSGNFGVVTSFEFDCHDVPSKIVNGVFLHPISDLAETLRFYREFTADAPDRVGATVGALHIPPTSDFPAEFHGDTVTQLTGYYTGDVEEGERALQPMREFGDPSLEDVHHLRYGDMEDDLLQAGRRNHWKNHFFTEITDDAITTFVEHALPLPEQIDLIGGFWPVGGAINRVDETATAYPHREATHQLDIVTQWSDSDDDEEVISWAREFHEAMAPYATGGEYVNNQTDDDSERVRAAFGDNYERLVEVKNEWDPQNLFRINQNIEPTV